MPTRLTRPVTRETSVTVRDGGRVREVIVTLEPSCVLALRLKGTRTTYRVTADAVYHLAVKREVAARQRERQANRKAKR
jgi:hypothetical protein